MFKQKFKVSKTTESMKVYIYIYFVSYIWEKQCIEENTENQKF